MAQGPFSGVSGVLTRIFGGTVQIHYGTGAARDVDAIFRHQPRETDAANGVSIQAMVPVLRASRSDLSDLDEGDLVDPGDGEIYRALFPEKSPSPAPDALINWQLELVE